MSTVEIQGNGFAAGYWGEDALSKATDAVKDVTTSVRDRAAEGIQKGVEAIDDVASSAANKTWDALSSAADNTLGYVPGYNELSDAAKKLIVDTVEGPLRDFAKTSLGGYALRGAGIMLTVLPVGGPSLGTAALTALNTAAIVVPGMLEGKSFGNALADEALYRIKGVATYFAGDLGAALGQQLADMIGPAVAGVVNLAKSVYPNLPPEQAIDQFIALSGLSPQKLADEMKVRGDSMAIAFDIAGRTPYKFLGDGSGYDPHSGKRVPTLAERYQANLKDTATAATTAKAAQYLAAQKADLLNRYKASLATNTASATRSAARTAAFSSWVTPAKPTPTKAPPTPAKAPITYVQSPYLAPPPPPQEDFMMFAPSSESAIASSPEGTRASIRGKVGVALAVFAGAWFFFYRR